MNQAKKQFVNSVQTVANALSMLENTMADIDSVWNARLYGPGAPNAITDLELGELSAETGISVKADDLYAFVIFCNQFKAFLHNQAAVQSDYSAVLDRLRNDI